MREKVRAVIGRTTRRVLPSKAKYENGRRKDQHVLGRVWTLS
jgi:hypothetical protein